MVGRRAQRDRHPRDQEKDEKSKEKERKLASLPYLIRSNFIKTTHDSRQQKHEKEKRNQEVKEREKRFSITRMVCAWRLHPNTRNQATARKRREKNPNKEMKNYNSKKEDLEEEDQRQDERDVGQGFLLPRILLAFR